MRLIIEGVIRKSPQEAGRNVGRGGTDDVYDSRGEYTWMRTNLVIDDELMRGTALARGPER